MAAATIAGASPLLIKNNNGIDTITLGGRGGAVRITSFTASVLYVRTDGSDPEGPPSAGAATTGQWAVPANGVVYVTMTSSTLKVKGAANTDVYMVEWL